MKIKKFLTFFLDSKLYSSEKYFPAIKSPEKKAFKEFEAAEKLILRWEEARECMIFDDDHRQEADQYLHAVDEIQKYSMESVTVSTNDHPTKINRFSMQIAMTRLQHEFHKILITHSNMIETDVGAFIYLNSSSNPMMSHVTESSAGFKTAHDQSTGEGYLEDEVSRGTSIYQSSNIFSLKAIYDLRSIAERMIIAGYLHECIQVYVSVRKPFVNSCFHCLGISKLNIGDAQILEWGAFEEKIREWIQAANVCVGILFEKEKRLCDQIFEGLGTIATDTCFMETVKGSAIQLFDFPEAISITQRTPEKLFEILDLHDALSDLSKVDIAFGSKLEFFQVKATEILSRLAEAARGILSEFENVVLSEPTNIPVLGGIIDPLTRYVMNYIVNLISDYNQTMMKLIVSNPSTGSLLSGDQTALDIDFPEPEDRSPLALHLIWIIVILQFKLEDKSRYYKDASLSHIFLMNNVHYIVQKVKRSPELREMIGDDYLRKLTLKSMQEATSYKRLTWTKILYCLREAGLHVKGSFSSWVSKFTLKTRFKTFNSMFEEVHRVQATWSVPDPQLREQLRISILDKLIPAYRSFLGQYRGHIESGKHPEKYIKYSVKDLEIAILDFFEGHTVSHHTRKITN